MLGAKILADNSDKHTLIKEQFINNSTCSIKRHTHKYCKGSFYIHLTLCLS